MTNAEKEEYLKKCTGCLSCKYFLGEDKYGWGHCILREKEKENDKQR